jgi:hypothetical protein
MQTADAVVRLQPIAGRWETCGVDRLRGVSAEGIRLDSNNWGPDTASFTLKRDPGALWPDLLAFTPVEIEIGGVLVWDGFISQTPTTDSDGGSINIQCKGWQYHLDDDSFEQVWVDCMMNSWKAPSDLLGAQTNYFRPNVAVEIGDGAITLGWKMGEEAKQNTYAAVIYDAGPDATISAISVTWQAQKGTNFAGASTGFRMYAKASSSVAGLANGTVNALGATGTALGTAGVTTSTGGTFSTPGRYVLLGLRRDDADLASTTAHYIAKISAVSVTSSTSYYNATSKKITGPSGEQIVTDALTRAPLINGPSDIRTASPSLNIPNFSATDGGQTPREYINRANSYYDFIAKVNPGRSFVFKPKPSAPTVAVGRWGGSRFEDASANSADEIYNKVVIEGTGPDGTSMRVARYASGIAGLVAARQTVDQTLFNGDFSAGTVGSLPTRWTVGNPAAATFVRTAASTAEFKLIDGAPWVSGAANSSNYTATGTLASGFTFKKGVNYTLTFTSTTTCAGLPALVMQPYCRFGTSTDAATVDAVSQEGLTNNITVSWSPTADAASSTVTIQLLFDLYPIDSEVFKDNDYLTIDDMTISYSSPTMVDRRGFTRTKRLQLESMVNSAVAVQLGDLYLKAHAQTPLKGSISIDGRGARDYLSGATIHPSQLLLEVGERIHLSHRIDPDTGAQGRDGDIAGVSYEHDSQSAQVSIDNQRNNFENFLARLAVLTGIGTQR